MPTTLRLDPLAGFARLPCPHGDAVCSRARRQPTRFHDGGLCIDCAIDIEAEA